jgi:hypothetical protein
MRINKEDCAGLVIDIQERLFPVMDHRDELLIKCSTLLMGLSTLDIPVLVTEQYPKGLGLTVDGIRQEIPSFAPIEKIAFSCYDEPAFRNSLELLSRKQVIICGIEAHVCVLQTVEDLLEAGYTPVVVADCISSRYPGDKTVALDRMQSSGATVTTCESLLFELTRVAGTDHFKAISRLVK